MNMNATQVELNAPDNGEADRLLRSVVEPETHTIHFAPVPTQSPGRARRVTAGLGLAALLLVAGYAGYRWWNFAHTWVTTNNAYVSGHVHAVSARVAGTVGEVLVSEYQAVEAGAVLARLDPSDLLVQRDKARAALAQAEAQIVQARAQVSRDEALAGKAQRDFDRANQLFHDNNAVISKQDFDTAKAAVDAAHAALNATKALLLVAEAQAKVAAAQLKDVELQLSYTEIVAPAAGRVGRKNLEVGNHVQPGQALLAIVEPEVWVTANFKETQWERLRPGQRVTLVLDSFPHWQFTGRIESLSPATGSQFALLPPDNATGNFTKIVQRVPVKVVFDKDSVRDWAGRIVPGMSVTVKVNVRS
jgi:membrane fusion protein (multidrug efflux system)